LKQDEQRGFYGSPGGFQEVSREESNQSKEMPKNTEESSDEYMKLVREKVTCCGEIEEFLEEEGSKRFDENKKISVEEVLNEVVEVSGRGNDKIHNKKKKIRKGKNGESPAKRKEILGAGSHMEIYKNSFKGQGITQEDVNADNILANNDQDEDNDNHIHHYTHSLF
jgi:hypothetical protein